MIFSNPRPSAFKHKADIFAYFLIRFVQTKEIDMKYRLTDGTYFLIAGFLAEFSFLINNKLFIFLDYYTLYF